MARSSQIDQKKEASAARMMFPTEIYLEILLRLPLKSTFVCKCVSKTWLSLISNPNFARSRLQLTLQTNKSSLILKGTDESRSCQVIYSISHDSLPSLLSADTEFLEYAVEMDYPFKSLYDSCELMGCCDGLVCLWFCFDNFDKNFLCLWNPATKEYRKLPKSPNADDAYDFNMIGLGYDSNSEDYKIVTCYRSVVEVYSLRLNSWTSIENVPYEFHSIRVVGVLVNRDLHWLAGAQDSSGVVVCLDAGHHVFKEIQLPNEPVVTANDKHMTVGVLEEGCLCLLVNVANVANVHSEVWVMQDYGVQESWAKRYMISHESMYDHFLSLLWSFKSGELVFGVLACDDLAIYDPKDKRVREPNLPSLTKLYQEGCYYESLVSLGSGTYVGGVEEEEEEEAIGRG